MFIIVFHDYMQVSILYVLAVNIGYGICMYTQYNVEYCRLEIICC